MNTRDAIVNALTRWELIWKAPAPVDKEAIDVWETAMAYQRVTAKEFEAASAMVIATSEFWPKPFQVLEKVEAIRQRVWENSLAGYVEALDPSGKPCLAHGSKVRDGRICLPGETPNGIGLNRVPVLEAPKSLGEITDAIEKPEAKALFLSLIGEHAK